MTRPLTPEEAEDNYFCNECGKGSETYPEAAPYWLMDDRSAPLIKWVWCDPCRRDNDPPYKETTKS